MRQLAHTPTGSYRIDDAVIDGKPVYERGEVPEGLLTLKQLDKQKRKYGPDQRPAAWLRYIRGGPPRPDTGRGKTRPRAIAPLYDSYASPDKRPCSPAQDAVLKAARHQRRLCDECGKDTGKVLQPGEICPDCSLKRTVAKALAEDGNTAKIRRSLARDLSATLKIKYTAALDLVNQATRLNSAPPSR